MYKYMLYYHPHYKEVICARTNTDLKIHLEKYGRFVTQNTTPVIIKEQNILYFSAKTHAEILHFCEYLTAIYNPNKNNLASYTKENYPELFL